jgi:DNA-binding NtrC family response regulator
MTIPLPASCLKICIAPVAPIELVTTASVAQARQAFDLGDFHLAILDQRLPDGNGLDLFAEMRQLRPRQTALMITGHAEVRDAMRAVREGLFDYLTKPFENLEELEAIIAKALEMDRAYREIADLKEILTTQSATPSSSVTRSRWSACWCRCARLPRWIPPC